jgi:hypothetical protein
MKQNNNLVMRCDIENIISILSRQKFGEVLDYFKNGSRNIYLATYATNNESQQYHNNLKPSTS